MSITEDGIFVCDFCGEDTGKFNQDTGNHPQCAELSALRARVEALEAEREKSREQIADVNELLWEFSENPYLELGEIGQNKIEDYFKKYSSNAQA